MSSKTRKNLASACSLLGRLMAGEVLTAREAAAGYPHNEHTARWHLRTLAEAVPGVVIVDEHPERFAYQTQHTRSVAGSLMALAAARALLAPYRDSAIGDALDALLKRELGGLAPEDRPPGDLSTCFVDLQPSAMPHGLEPGVVDEIAEGLLQHRAVRATYTHFDGREDEVILHPLSLLTTVDGLYCYAECASGDHQGERRTYNVRRIERARALREHFDYPGRQDYDPDKEFEASFAGFVPRDRDGAQATSVELLFAPSWRHYLNTHRVHGSQQIAGTREDGRIEVTLDVYINYDLVRWVRGIGNDVEVLVPSSLAEWVRSGDGVRR